MMMKLNLFRKLLVLPVPRRSLNRSWVIIQLEGIVPPNSPPARNFFSTEVVLQPKTENVERVKTLLRDYGITDTHISEMFTKLPILFNYSPEKILLPKLDFFRSMGFSNADIDRVLSSNPAILTRNLQNQIIPCYNYLKSFLISDEKVASLLKRHNRVLLSNIEKDVVPNIAALREAGVPEPRIVFLLWNAPKALFRFHSRLVPSIKKATEMGICPSKLSFVRALQVFTMTEATWEHKKEVLRGCGFSDAEILLAFRSYPHFVETADLKIVRIMDFLVKKMGWKPLDIAQNPSVLNSSLEKRIVPRCTVLKALQTKGLVKGSVSLGTLIPPKEDVFLLKFVKKYQEDFPELMDIYLGKKGLQKSKIE